MMCHHQPEVPNVLKKTERGCFSQSHLGSNLSHTQHWPGTGGRDPGGSSSSVLLETELPGTGETKASSRLDS